ncbi:MAG: MlaD family protein [Bacteroidales bacterium]|nr:MlaD family protein [Bacteroidales bacterium]
MKIKKEITISICVIVALCLLFLGIDFLKGVNVFKPANYYTATYTNVNGLAVSAPVTLNGFKVGLVRSIEYQYDNPGHVAVELSLDKELKLPVGSKAVIVCDMLGTATVQLELTANKEFYPVGSEVESETASGLMDSVSKDLMPNIAEIFPKVDSLLTSINKLVSDPAVIASVKRLDAITANLESTTNSLNKSVKSLPVLMSGVNSTVDNVNRLTGNLAEVSEDLKSCPLDSTLQNIQQTTENLRMLTQELNNPNSTLGLLMKDPELYNNLNNTVKSLDSLFVDIKKSPKRYINIKLL